MISLFRSWSIIFLTLTGLALCAQNEVPLQVIGSGGNSLSKSVIVDQTLGETFIFQLSDTATKVDQGFHQSFFKIVQLKESELCDVDLQLYPNPTERFLNVRVGEGVILPELKCEIFNFQGGKLAEFPLEKNETVDLLFHESNQYIFRFTQESTGCSGVFKVFKN